ncbi:MAG TPA: hypothetical protein VNK96_01885 [Fimbriimonadales bacterium]|nr:hypothetical protein [Fimbriimonadales bacterium]
MLWAVVGCSSPFAGAAIFQDEEFLGGESRYAPHAGSATSLGILKALLEKHGLELSEIELFAADVGPGSFTGAKVGVTIAKCLAYALGKKTAGLSAFDLIAPPPNTLPVAIPCRKNKYLLREHRGSPPILVSEDDPRLENAIGYGSIFAHPVYPLPENAGHLFSSLEPIEPELLLPEYVLEPSISEPKRPYPRV